MAIDSKIAAEIEIEYPRTKASRSAENHRCETVPESHWMPVAIPPSKFPNWNTVYGVLRNWRIDDTWKLVHDRLREKVRKLEGRDAMPTAAIIYSQSVKTADGDEQREYDAGKKVTARKRHIAFDTLGCRGSRCGFPRLQRWPLRFAPNQGEVPSTQSGLYR
ncbi:MAG: hypothetical protein AAF664_26560 [Planctomycetota bacterium]